MNGDYPCCRCCGCYARMNNHILPCTRCGQKLKVRIG